MALTIYTNSEEDKLIEDAKIKAIREKTSVSVATKQLLRMWVEGKIKLNGNGRTK